MIDIPLEWQAIVAVAYSVRTAIEVIRHYQRVQLAVLLMCFAVVAYFGVDLVAMLGWKFNAAAFGAHYVKLAFNTLLLAGATMDGHDVIKNRIAGKLGGP